MLIKKDNTKNKLHYAVKIINYCFVGTIASTSLLFATTTFADKPASSQGEIKNHVKTTINSTHSEAKEKIGAITVAQGPVDPMRVAGSTRTTAGLGSAYSIGQQVLGGVVFWLDSTSQHGLIVAMQDDTHGAVAWDNEENHHLT